MSFIIEGIVGIDNGPKIIHGFDDREWMFVAKLPGYVLHVICYVMLELLQFGIYKCTHTHTQTDGMIHPKLQ
jgi:hypothetical protein